MRALRLLLLAAACVCPGRSPLAGEPATRIVLEVDTPPDGARIGAAQRLAFVAGRALAVRGAYETFEILFALDTSRSTADPAGTDVDGDGTVEQPVAGRGSVFGRIFPLQPARRDTILAAEVAAARTLLGQLDPRTTRVGVISFAGDADPLTPDARSEARISADYARVERALDAILARGPRGMTNVAEALDLALAELGPDRPHGPRGEARRIVMLMTDGQPTLPIENAHAQNTRLVLERAARARAARIRIDTYALGPEALREPFVVVELAAVSGGAFTPVIRPSDLRTLFREISFSEIEQLDLVNRTNGAHPQQLVRRADGAFAALIELADGLNRIELEARATDGTQARREWTVHWAPGAAEPGLDAEQLAQRNRLLELRLLDLQRSNAARDAERDRRLLDALREEIRDQRAQAEQRAARVRKQLEIEAETR